MDSQNDVPDGRITNLKKAKILLAAVLSLFLLVVVIQNSGAIALRVLFWDVWVHLVLLIPLVFLIGVIVGYVARRRRPEV